jgi:hypothetical protein
MRLAAPAPRSMRRHKIAAAAQMPLLSKERASGPEGGGQASVLALAQGACPLLSMGPMGVPTFLLSALICLSTAAAGPLSAAAAAAPLPLPSPLPPPPPPLLEAAGAAGVAGAGATGAASVSAPGPPSAFFAFRFSFFFAALLLAAELLLSSGKG